ncbi:MAG: hypothetical protein SFU53_09680 [Terrimicrobiaceae bacterium]|nr:hypothetical protein [Terrimicrobiaceae bacterium]
MENPTTSQQKIEKLEAEKRQIEERIRRLRHEAKTTERKRLTRAKIILGGLVLRDHEALFSQLLSSASEPDKEVLRAVFPQMVKEAPLPARK